MNFVKALKGVFLSLLFLVFFGYLISGANWILANSKSVAEPDQFLGSVSGTIMEDPLEITSSSALSIKTDLQGFRQEIFQKNSPAKLPIASLTKLMAAVIVLDNYDLDHEISVNEAADLQAAVKDDVKQGDAMPISSFLEIMLIKSSNKSAYVLSEFIGTEKFVELMNRRAKEIGLENTFFVDPTGLSSGNVSTAIDLTVLAEYILENYPKIAQISQIKEVYVPQYGTIFNTDQLLEEIPEIIFGKTGFTLEAKGCLIVALKNFKENNYFINVVLGSEDRFLDMKKIISTFSN